MISLQLKIFKINNNKEIITINYKFTLINMDRFFNLHSERQAKQFAYFKNI